MTVSIKRRPFEYSHTIGMLALTGKGFSNPVDMVAGENSIVYVLNRSNAYQAQMGAIRVTVCDIDAEEFISQFATYGEEDGQCVWPTSIARDRQGNCYISDEHRHDVQVFDPDGKFVRKWGGRGSDAGQLDRPSGLAVNADGNIVVVDHLNNRIQTFTPEGQTVGLFGSAGSGAGQFNLPWGVGTDARGNLYVADWRNDRVQKFTSDGQHLATIGTSGSADGQLKRPANVSVDDEGMVYVADWGNERIAIFTAEGYPMTNLIGDSGMSKWGAQFLNANQDLLYGRKIMADGTAEKRFWGPTAVEIDDRGRVLVVDSCRHRIQVYHR